MHKERMAEFLETSGGRKKPQRFGLVFEEHIPETCALYDLPVQTGAIVQRRDDIINKSLWRVVDLKPETKEATLTSIENEKMVTALIEDLLVIKTLDEPIYPVLTPLGSINRGREKPFHAVINGENYHALQLLRFLFEGQVDCIYIDPPYNTGASDWTYNNRYVDAKDSWRHSKWLSFMEKRLKLSKHLLKQDGVLIVTIDEHEVHHLGMLLEKLFPEYLRYMVTIVINPKGTAKANFSRVEEYAFFIVPNCGYDIIEPRHVQESLDNMLQLGDINKDYLKINEDENDVVDDIDIEHEEDEQENNDNEQWEIRHARRRGSESSYRHQRPNQFYPIYIDEEVKKVVRVGSSIPLDMDPDFNEVDGLRPIWPIDAEEHHRVWRFIPESMQTLIDEDQVVLGTYNKKRDYWTINYKVPRKLTRKIKTVWWTKGYDAGTHGTQILRRILGEPGLFPFPKSIYAVRDCVAAVVRKRPNALILDFFAGSGTTFHSTCILNAQDGGNRRTILVTNNEVSIKTAKRLNKNGYYQGDIEFEKHGIFQKVTRPRCEAIVTGRTPMGEPIPGKHLNSKGKALGRPFNMGFEENVEFYKINYLNPDDIDLGLHFESLLPSLWLASGGIGERELPLQGADFSIPSRSNYAVLFNEARFRKLKDVLKTRPDVRNIWIITDSEEAFSEIKSELPNNIKTSMLYRDYFRKMKEIGG